MAKPLTSPNSRLATLPTSCLGTLPTSCLAAALAFLMVLLGSAHAVAQIGRSHHLEPGFGTWGSATSFTTDGMVDSSIFGTSATGVCSGFIKSAPDITLVVDEPLHMTLSASASYTNLGLVIHGPDGVRCSGIPTAAGVELDADWPPGRYSVYVSVATQYTYESYTIAATETTGSAVVVPVLPEVVVTPGDDSAFASWSDSGLSWMVLRSGSGAMPSPSSDVEVHYSGWTLDGVVFDSSVDRGTPATFPVTGLIEGWQEVLPLMREGELRRIWVPGNLAYGWEINLIRPFGTLVFDIELRSVLSDPVSIAPAVVIPDGPEGPEAYVVTIDAVGPSVSYAAGTVTPVQPVAELFSGSVLSPSRCDGLVAPTPDLLLQLDYSQPNLSMNLALPTRGVLILTNAGRTFLRCAETNDALDRLLDGPIGAGTYQLFIGVNQDEPTDPSTSWNLTLTTE